MIKPKFTSKILLSCALAAGALLSADTPLQAQTFAYTNCDLVAGFRQAGGSSDLVVNLGPVAAFEKISTRTAVVLTNVNSAQLADALPSLNGVQWSISAAMRGNTNYSQYDLQTVWVTSPRPNIYSPGPVWTRQSHWSLGGVASQIEAIGAGAAVYGNGQAAGVDNRPTGILIPPANQYAYSYLIGTLGDFSGAFQGNVENTTPDDFETSGLPSRSVLYKLAPSTGSDTGTPGAIIGFFDFATNGILSFTAGPPPEQTTITKVTRQNTITKAWFFTVSGVNYRLRYTDSAGLTNSISNWSVGSSVVGDGTILSLSATNVSDNLFYTVESY